MMVRKLFNVALATVALMCVMPIANAQEEQGDGVLMPMNAWLVGPTTLAEGSNVDTIGIPCLMVTNFSNGYEMRISGGDKVIMAMALNVRSNNFTAGESYQMGIGFAADETVDLPALAFSEDTLVVGLEEEKDFYEKLQASDSLFVGLGDKQMQFSLLGVPQALKRLEQCFTAPGEDSSQAASEEAPREEDQASVEDLPESDIAGIKTLDKEDLKELHEISASSGDEGNALPEEPSAEKPAAVPAEIAKVPEAKPRDIMIPSATLSPTRMVAGQKMRWRVMKGGGLQGVLEVWAKSAGAEIIWKSPSSFSVPESLVLEGTFEEGVQAVLGLFPQGQLRPVGNLYVSPSTGHKTLVIQEVQPVDKPVETVNYAPIIAP
ncbi:MAG: TcpQ domain-containing protein [Micavibrio sp.]